MKIPKDDINSVIFQISSLRAAESGAEQYERFIQPATAYLYGMINAGKNKLEKTKHYNPTTISLPDELLDKLDYLRHDVPRSKYIQRIIEQHLRFMELA